MAFLPIRCQSLLLLVALCSIVTALMQSVHGGLILVGGSFGWQYSDPRFFDYQAWASSHTFIVSDTLSFGYPNAEYGVSVFAPGVADCELNGTKITSTLVDQPVEYQFVFAGQFGFTNWVSDYCNKGMRFTVNVTTITAPTSADPPAFPAPSSRPSSTSLPRRVHRTRVGWIVGSVTGVVGAFLLLAAVAIMTRRRYRQKLRKPSSGTDGVILPYMSDPCYHSPHKKDIELPGAPQRFSYEELNAATEGFNSSLVVGEGGFGTVYKGHIKESTPVAVKRLSPDARQGAQAFLAELNIISQLRHRNLVQLVGWCHENGELIIVYEFMPNGDLDELIFGGNHGDPSARSVPLSWICRRNILWGVATALVYLHEEWEQRVVHRDVKTSNVMLDSQFNARLGDFGLARLSAHSQAPRTTLMAGTIGYLAPEFNLTGRATDKTDVYAFGVVILEVVCARRPLTSNCILVDLAWELHEEDKLLDAIDPKLDERSASEDEEMKRTIQVGLMCCHPDPSSRPTMRHVLNILTGETPLPRMPRSRPVAIFAEDYNSDREVESPSINGLSSSVGG